MRSGEDWALKISWEKFGSKGIERPPSRIIPQVSRLAFGIKERAGMLQRSLETL